MSRLHKIFLMSEMARHKGEATKALLAWAAEQTRPFTIRQAFDVYVANGGRENSITDNIQSFTTQFQGYVAKQRKAGLTPKRGKAPYWPPSNERPLVPVVQGARGRTGDRAGSFIWADSVPKPSGASRFVNPDDDNNTGAAMDSLEKALSYVGKGLPLDQKVGRQKLTAAIERWKKMKSLSQIVADIKASIPKKGQMDALHIATEFLMDQGKIDQSDVDDAEDAVAEPTGPEDDEDDVFGGFGDDEEPLDMDFDEEEPEEEPAKSEPEPKAGVSKPGMPGTKYMPNFGSGAYSEVPPDEEEPELDLDFDEEEPTEPDVEPSTAQQAGASQFVKPTTSGSKKSDITKSPVSKFMKGFKKR